MAHVLIPGLSRGSVGAICTQAASWALPTSTLRSLTLASVMRSRRKTDHLERTATVLRREVMAAAKVCEITHESPSVKSLRLLVADKDFSFKAGQWVDFFIPGVSVVGGFSICSSPQQLERERIIELAVKYTNHPPAVWVHNKVSNHLKHNFLVCVSTVPACLFVHHMRVSFPQRWSDSLELEPLMVVS
uniref:oxidoreductase NAD-binding domain-containing protein 1 isoform 5 n=1 Tax=Rattus norvegicus TaxID=10116 RepID=UPI003B3BB708